MASESRTMTFARSQQQLEKFVPALFQQDGEPSAFSTAVIPRTIIEQYWAVRALVAEVKLAERAHHYAEVLHLTREEETRRHATLDNAHRMHDNRVAKLEKVIGALVLALVAGAGLVSYRSHHGNTQSSVKSSWPHLTIPVLSPFTSVVEQEVSAIGFRAISVFILVAGLVIYMLIRHRMSSARQC